MKNYQDEIRSFLDQYLISVQKPGRYIGGEFNQVLKNWPEAQIKVALAFPDIYEIGFSNLGLAVLYDIINSQDFALAERTFAPWQDFERLLREHQVPLYSLESKTPLRFFDLIGFSLPYETLYTNLINMLDLAMIPIHSSARAENDPIILAGGHACFNPEPMHAFIDVFAIGEGEEIILDILKCLSAGKINILSRREIINSLADIDGVYIPAHFQVFYDGNQNISAIKNVHHTEKNHIIKRIVKKLPPPPPRLLVPNIQVVHDRVAIEIMRGCSRGCRFCQAGFITRPVRERTTEVILEAISSTIQSTGYEEVALLSLSSSDYSKINELIMEIDIRSKDLKYSFSLPSLRIESFDDALVGSMKNKRKGNFTIAPESASEKIREKINKPITDQDLLGTVENIFSMGWQNVKLYYMIGFPDENHDDVEKIATMCNQIFSMGKNILHKKPKIHVSINTFIPKPHTPLQWASFPDRDVVENKYKSIINNIAYSGIKINWSDYDSTYIETCLARGDRRLSQVIETAWRNGCKFDAWHEHFQIDHWLDAFTQNQINPNIYTVIDKSTSEILPWDHIGTGVEKNYLIQEYNKSQDFEITGDCKEMCHACGIQVYCGQKCSQLRLAK